MAEDRILVSVHGVSRYHFEGEETRGYAIVLRDDAGREMALWVGMCELWAITLVLEAQTLERPGTYEAMLCCLAATGASVEEIYINDLRDEIYYARVSLRTGNEVHWVDMRPSDAVNLALRVGCPIFVSREVFEMGLKGSVFRLLRESRHLVDRLSQTDVPHRVSDK